MWLYFVFNKFLFKPTKKRRKEGNFVHHPLPNEYANVLQDLKKDVNLCVGCQQRQQSLENGLGFTWNVFGEPGLVVAVDHLHVQDNVGAGVGDVPGVRQRTPPPVALAPELLHAAGW